MENEIVEAYVERPEFFENGQTTIDGYIWKMQGGLYTKVYQGEWDERSQ